MSERGVFIFKSKGNFEDCTKVEIPEEIKKFSKRTHKKTKEGVYCEVITDIPLDKITDELMKKIHNFYYKLLSLKTVGEEKKSEKVFKYFRKYIGKEEAPIIIKLCEHMGFMDLFTYLTLFLINSGAFKEIKKTKKTVKIQKVPKAIEPPKKENKKSDKLKRLFINPKGVNHYSLVKEQHTAIMNNITSGGYPNTKKLLEKNILNQHNEIIKNLSSFGRSENSNKVYKKHKEIVNKIKKFDDLDKFDNEFTFSKEVNDPIYEKHEKIMNQIHKKDFNFTSSNQESYDFDKLIKTHKSLMNNNETSNQESLMNNNETSDPLVIKHRKIVEMLSSKKTYIPLDQQMVLKSKDKDLQIDSKSKVIFSFEGKVGFNDFFVSGFEKDTLRLYIKGYGEPQYVEVNFENIIQVKYSEVESGFTFFLKKDIKLVKNPFNLDVSNKKDAKKLMDYLKKNQVKVIEEPLTFQNNVYKKHFEKQQMFKNELSKDPFEDEIIIEKENDDTNCKTCNDEENDDTNCKTCNDEENEDTNCKKGEEKENEDTEGCKKKKKKKNTLREKVENMIKTSKKNEKKKKIIPQDSLIDKKVDNVINKN